jgi:protein O-mannosyl-transferase
MTHATTQLDIPALEPLDGAAHPPAKLDKIDGWIIAMLLAITVLLYARTATFGFVNYDDSSYVYDNPHLDLGLGLEGIRWAITTGYFSYWHPLTWLTYLATTTVFGVRAGPIHAVNFLLHAANAGLLFYLLRRTTGQRWPAAVAAALWAWHPLRVESVAWVSETKDVLSIFFGLLTLAAYTVYAARPGWWRYLLVSLALLGALASKPTMVTLPAILLLLDYWPLNRWRLESLPRLIGEKIPWFLMVAAVAAQAYRVQRGNRALEISRLLPLSGRLQNAVVSMLLYIRHFVWPTHLSVFYPHPCLTGQVIPPWKWGGAVVLLIAFTLWAMRQRRDRPYVWIGWLWFLGTLVPMIGIVQAGEQGMADRYTLLPSIGLTIVVVWSVANWKPATERAYKWLAVSAILVLVSLLLMTERQIGYWRDTFTLFSHANDVIPNNYLARSIMADDLQKSGRDLDHALALSRSAVKICPNLPYSYCILGSILDRFGDYEEEIEAYRAGAATDPLSPQMPNAIGMVLMNMDRNAEAIDEFHKAILIDANFADAHYHLARLLTHDGKFADAILQWQQAIHLDPHNGVYHGFFGDALGLKGDRAGAIQQYSAAIAEGEHRPQWEASLTWYLATDPNTSAANIQRVIPFARDAVTKTKSEDPQPLDALAAVLARSGQFDQAAAIARQAVDRALAKNQPTLAKAIGARLQLYEQGEPYLETLNGER